MENWNDRNFKLTLIILPNWVPVAKQILFIYENFIWIYAFSSVNPQDSKILAKLSIAKTIIII